MRQEIELPLEEATFLQLRELLPAPMIRKDYRVYALPDGHRLECSLVDGEEPGGFYYAEVEFGSVEESEAFVPPAFLGPRRGGWNAIDYNTRRQPCQAKQNSRPHNNGRELCCLFTRAV